ncbi:hypothetical protein SDRG_00436 [Saprolegnia diclina VS20]|uniref:Tyrosine specific protein phosphatases domain-containing protein n=1 Tax=Saprolegnia diclina (strain VS20) TaxID=1156394 RepID=T0QWU2_SAPDV|nr:hypothetical protein SDRG_00436 [Saprolegnia diclina VS20]EQC42709.1 hypothetical protein SDRG_00436 [Saprolegnia diclina VS20]|eukprot:XP_008604132.1 hypothetical protein SDRG_00436 [Saprolegnia diclina VS20]
MAKDKDELVAKKARREEHLRTIYATLEAIVPTYEAAIATLEAAVASNRTPRGVEQWFFLYLRIVDVGVQIRRGELRHRSTTHAKYKSLTKTVHANATTNGLGIDDANVLINDLEKIHRQLKKRKPMQLDMLESQFDILDRDTIGPLDKRVFECKRSMESRRSVHYSSCAIVVHGDLHVELVIKDGTDIILTSRRICTSMAVCVCTEDAEPWRGFTITESAPPAKKPMLRPVTEEPNDAPSLNDLKKSFGVDVDERERTTEAFHNEALGLPPVESAPSLPDSRTKRRCLPLQQAVQKEVASALDAYSQSTVHAILAALKPVGPPISNGSVPCAVYFNLIEWSHASSTSVDKVTMVANIASSANLHVAKWVMQDMALPVAEASSLITHLAQNAGFRHVIELALRGLMTPYTVFSGLLASTATLPLLESLDLSYNSLQSQGPALAAVLKLCPRLRSLHLEQCRLDGLESDLLQGLEDSGGLLETLVLADNALTARFVGGLFGSLSTPLLHTLDLRHVQCLGASQPAAFAYQSLPALQHLMLDASTLLQDASFVSSLNSALLDESCVLRTLSLQCTSPPLDAMVELLGHVTHYGQLERLSLVGIPSLPPLHSLVCAGLAKCAELDLTLDLAALQPFVASLSAARLPALKYLRVRISSPTSPEAIERLRGDVLLHVPAIKTIEMTSRADAYAQWGMMKRSRDREMRSWSPPEHWEDVAKVGGRIATGRFGHLVCARVPLDAKYAVDGDESWTPLELLDTCFGQGLSVHMVIDLTNTYKYYSGANELETRNVEYVKMRVEGFADVPSEDIVDRFIDVVSRWEASLARYAPDDLAPVAVVHCTHGLNRTGYLVVRYLMATQGLSVKDALRTFAAARPPGLIKHMYVQKLFEMFDQVDELELPVLPLWAQTKYDRSQDQLASADIFKATEDDRDVHEKVRDREKRRHDRRSPPKLRRMPENWRHAPKIGTLIAHTNVVAMRTLLSADYSVPPSETWTPEAFVAAQAAAGLNVQLVIDLTNTTKYYDDIPGVRHEKLVCEGFHAAPTTAIVDAFIALVTQFDASPSSSGGHIAVHCTHGLNRTGYLIIHYLVRVKGLSLVDALAAFADARPPGLLKPSYIEALFEMYAPNDVVTYPTSLPAWALAKYSKEHNSTKKGQKKKTKNMHVTEAKAATHARKPPPMQWYNVPNAGAPILSRGAVTFVPLKTMLDDRYDIGAQDWTPSAFEAWNANENLDAIISMDGLGFFYDPAQLSVPVFEVRLLNKSFPNPPLIASFYNAIAMLQEQHTETTRVRIGLQCATMSRAAFFLLHYLMTQDKLSLDDAMALYSDAYPPAPLLNSLHRHLRKLDTGARPMAKKIVFESDESDVDEPFGSHVETTQPSS